MNADPRCRIGRVRPKLRVVESPAPLTAEDFTRVENVIADMIERIARDGVLAYAVVTVDADGRVDRNAVMRPTGAQHALIGGLTAMACDLAAEL